MAGNLADALSAVVQALYKDHDVLHDYVHHPYEFGKENLPFGMGMMGRYVAPASWVNLNDGEFCFIPITASGKMMTDATFAGSVVTAPTRFNRRFYVELTATAVDTPVSFVDAVHGAFTADQVMIVNDDASDAVYLEYGAAAAADANHVKVDYGEAYVDQYQNGDVHVICPALKTASIRIWAWAEV